MPALGVSPQANSQTLAQHGVQALEGPVEAPLLPEPIVETALQGGNSRGKSLQGQPLFKT